MHISELVRLALQEDVGGGDVTTEATIPASHRSCAKITAKQGLVVFGHEIAREVFSQMRLGAVNAVHITVGYHEEFSGVVDNLQAWNGWFEKCDDLIAPAYSCKNIQKR